MESITMSEGDSSTAIGSNCIFRAYIYLPRFHIPLSRLQSLQCSSTAYLAWIYDPPRKVKLVVWMIRRYGNTTTTLLYNGLYDLLRLANLRVTMSKSVVSIQIGRTLRPSPQIQRQTCSLSLMILTNAPLSLPVP